MYEDKATKYENINLFGLKLFERVSTYRTMYDHEFAPEEESQIPLADKEVVTYKLFGIPLLNFKSGCDPKGLIPDETKKFKLPPINKYWKVILIVIAALILLSISFIAGIKVANSDKFNNTFYIESRQMENLNIRSLMPYEKALRDAYTQTEMNAAAEQLYQHYHAYYETVVERIKNYDFWDEKAKVAVLSYIDGYNKRKEVMEQVLFPHMNDSAEEGGYGTILGLLYPNAMYEFDRQELLTYRMILSYMYAAISEVDIEMLFSE